MRPRSKHKCFCWICGSAVDLQTCKTDKHGVAVHEDCYSLKVALATESKRLVVRKRVHRMVASDVHSRNRQSCAN
jgi:hypothetical protein